jgi:UPF0755 protein
MRLTRLRLLVLALVLLLAVAAVAAGMLYGRLREPFRGYSESERFVEIPPGTSVPSIGARLVEAGVIRDELTFRIAIWKTGAARSLQAGEYRFDRALTPEEVIGRIARGDVYLLTVTFPEGLNVDEMARLFEEAGLGPAREFLVAARNPAPIAALDPEAPDLEGYLFPDTYRVPRKTTASALVARMVRGFEQAFDPALRQEAQARGYTVRQAVTLAALVEKETARPDERPIVSAVYTNRLKIGMGLQCDPTVIYALQRVGKYTGNLTRDDLAFDSPYNTYRYAGLPPGPIASPGRASLEAAVRPADVPYLYFVSRNDGSHVFATSLAEHNRNVHEYQIRYFRERRR